MKIEPKDWHELEGHLGQPIPPDMRDQLIQATNDFLSFAVFEMRAEPLGPAIARVEAIGVAAKKFSATLMSGNQGDAGFYARHLIERNFLDARIGERHKTNQLLGIMTSFIVGCIKAKEALSAEPAAEWVKGECWEGWIRKLTSILKSRGLPTQVRKDSDKNAGRKASAFVRFVSILQGCFDQDYRRGVHSPTAMAEAITKARRVSKDRASAIYKTR